MSHSTHATTLFRSSAVLVSPLLIAAFASADVRVDSTYVEGDVIVLGGGGATPVPGEDNQSQLSYTGSASVNAHADTGVQLAHDGLGNIRGDGQGVGTAIASCSTSGLSLMGSGSAVAHFNASPDLGVGQAITRTEFAIERGDEHFHIVLVFVANLLQMHESPDQVQLRRVNPGVPEGPILLCNSLAPALNHTGTLQPGHYRLFGHLGASESGGPIHSPGDEAVSYDFNMTFDAGTVLTFNGPIDSGQATCFGDGTGTTCPCGNNGALGAGCASSSTTGAVLEGHGGATFGDDYFRLSVTGIPGIKPGLCVKGSTPLGGGMGILVGDGLLCSNPQIRSQVISSFFTGSLLMTDWKGQPFGTYPSAANMGAPTYYQWWYRDVDNTCSGAGFNFTNAWVVNWQ